MQTFPRVSRSLWQRCGSAVACCRVRGTEGSSTCTGPFEGCCHYFHYLHHSLVSGGTQPHPSQKTSQSNGTRTTALSNSLKLSHACGATQDGRVMVERSDRMWSTGEGNGKPLQYSCLENPINSMKRQNDRILKEELTRSVSAQYVTGDQWRNNSRKNEGMEPKANTIPSCGCDW